VNANRRTFLKTVGQGTLAASLVMSLPELAKSEADAADGGARNAGNAAGVAAQSSVAASSSANFSKEYLANQVFWEQPLSLNPVPAGRYDIVTDPSRKEAMGTAGGGKQTKSGVFAQPNGDLQIKIYAPETKNVEVYFLAMEPRPRIALQKQDDGMHTGVFPFDPTFCGPMSTDIYFDGTILLYPYIPIFWHRERPVNFIEIPDPETDWIQLRDVPHGAFARELFPTKSFGVQRCMVYTPPDYYKGGEFPVLYLQAGSGENESTWEYNGRAAHIVDNLLAESKCKPFIIVTCDGGVGNDAAGQYTQRVPDHDSMAAFRDMLLNDVIPFIESRYRVKKGKWNRAMAGLSRGCRQTSSTGIPHPEVFGYLGMFSGYMASATETGGRPEELAILRDPKRFANEFKVVFRSMGAADHLMPHFLEDNKKFEEGGLDKMPNYHYKLYPNQQHVWGAFRRGLHDFAQLIFT